MSVSSHSGSISGALTRAGINRVGWGDDSCIATGWLLSISQLSSSLLAKQNGNNDMNRSSIVYIVAYIVLYDSHISTR